MARGPRGGEGALTARQREALRALRAFEARHGMPPTRAELGRRLGVSAQTADYHLRALERKGYLELGRKARALRLLPPAAPEAPEPPEGAVTRWREVPLLGRVAAGNPLLALEDAEDRIPLPEGSRADYALRVEGDSMRDAGILDGDVVLVERGGSYLDGEIVVAVLGAGEVREATVKRLRRCPGGWLLEAANPAYCDRQVGPQDGLEVAGRVVGLMRTWNQRPASRRNGWSAR